MRTEPDPEFLEYQRKIMQGGQMEDELAYRVHSGNAKERDYQDYITVLESKIDAMKTSLEQGAKLLQSAVLNFTEIEKCEVIWAAVSEHTKLLYYHQDYHDAEDMGVGSYVMKQFYAVPVEKIKK